MNFNAMMNLIFFLELQGKIATLQKLHCEKYFTITNQKYSYSTQQQMVLLKFSNSGMLK